MTEPFRATRRQVHLVVALILMSATSLAAQSLDSRCTDPAVVGVAGDGADGCQVAVDLFSYLNGEVGRLLTGGNPTFGQAGGTGGLGHFGLGLRGVVTRHFALPTVDGQAVAPGAAQRHSFVGSEGWGGAPVLDLTVGLFKGARLGRVRIGSLDGIATAFVAPAKALDLISDGQFDVSRSGAAWKFGFGGKLGLLEGSGPIPSVSVAYTERAAPDLDFTYRTNDDEFALDGVRLKAKSWRVVVGTRLAIFRFSGGWGRDTYATSGALRFLVSNQGADTVQGASPFTVRSSRTNLFGGLRLGWLAVEIGRVSGAKAAGDQPYNQFARPQSAAWTYYAGGLRIGF